jgi:hypothetical protein
MGRQSQSVSLPSDQPLLIVAGAAICFWGIALLFAALPSLGTDLCVYFLKKNNLDLNSSNILPFIS